MPLYVVGSLLQRSSRVPLDVRISNAPSRTVFDNEAIVFLQRNRTSHDVLGDAAKAAINSGKAVAELGFDTVKHCDVARSGFTSTSCVCRLCCAGAISV